MPAEHIVFIPAVFFLGLFVGGMLVRRMERSRKSELPASVAGMSEEGPARQTAAGWPVLGALVIVVIAFASTHVLPLFGGSRAISVVVSGLPLFDQKPSFAGAEVFARLNAYGAEGRAMYQHFTYTTDVLFPLTILLFLFLLARYQSDRISISATLRKLLLRLPFIWFAADMLENSMVFSLIAGLPERNDLLASSLGFVTVGKFALLLLAMVAPLLCSVVFRHAGTEDSVKASAL